MIAVYKMGTITRGQTYLTKEEADNVGEVFRSWPVHFIMIE